MKLHDQIKAEIRDNLNPEDVFTDEQLIAWATRCHSAHEVFPLKDLKNSVADAKVEWKM